MHRKRNVAAVLTGVIIASLGLTACASENTQGTSDQTITIYSGRGETLIADLITLFTEDTGISASVRYGDSAELAAQILEEGSNSPADVFLSQDAGSLAALSKLGFFKALPTEITSLVDSKYRATDNTWVGISGRARVISYNPKKVPEVPKSVLELADPVWKGRIGIAPSNASFQAFVTALRVIKGEDVAFKFLQGMKENAVLFEQNSQILAAVESGVIDAGLVNHYYWYELAAERGAENMTSKFAWFEQGDVGNLVNVAGVGVLNDKLASREFAAWLLGERAQQYFVDKTKEYSLTGLAQAEGLIPLSEIQSPEIDLSDLDSLSMTLDLIRKAGLL